MKGMDDDIKNANRRHFLRGAGAMAGGAALLGTAPSVEAEDPKVTSPASPVSTKGAPAPVVGRQGGDRPGGRRASGPMANTLEKLGPLRELAGTWVGRGFNTISLPDFDNPAGAQPFRVKLNATREILEFTQIGGKVPNRGSQGQPDIDLFGLTYLQRISDALSNGPLHIEPGIWLHVPATVVPAQPETVVRMGSIPHGTSLLAQGFSLMVPSGPQIDPVDTTPTKGNVPVTDEGYLAPFSSATLPPGFRPTYLKNPNLALQADILGQDIVETTVLIISTAANPGKDIQAGSIGNIPFLDGNAKATQLDAIFWVEKVQQPDGSVFLQLQYTQTTILNFLGINWPHISVATLLKQ